MAGVFVFVIFCDFETSDRNLEEHTLIYHQNTLHLIGQCDVAMVTDSHFEYAN